MAQCHIDETQFSTLISPVPHICTADFSAHFHSATYMGCYKLLLLPSVPNSRSPASLISPAKHICGAWQTSIITRNVLIEAVWQRCLDRYNPHLTCSMEDAMVAFRERLGFRQYMPGKPTKYGIKVRIRADPTNGFVNDFQVYTGRTTAQAEGRLVSRVVKD